MWNGNLGVRCDGFFVNMQQLWSCYAVWQRISGGGEMGGGMKPKRNGWQETYCCCFKQWLITYLLEHESVKAPPNTRSLFCELPELHVDWTYNCTHTKIYWITVTWSWPCKVKSSVWHTHMNNTPCTAALIFWLQLHMTINTQLIKYILEQKRKEQQNNLSKQTLVT